MKRLIVCAALMLAACGAKTGDAPKATQAEVSAPNAATLEASTVAPEAPSETVDAAASVARVVGLERGDAKLYSTVGGDPAINGEYVFIAVMGDPAQGAKVFQIGDFNTWEIVRQTPESVVLKVSHSAIDASGDIVTAVQDIAVTVPAFEATEISVTPAE